MPTVNTNIYASLRSAVSAAQGTTATPSIDAGNFVDFGRATMDGSGVDEMARAAIEAHAGNTEIHVMAADRAAWNGKAEISDIPSTLPADGGNADTVDGKHAADFSQNLGYWRDEKSIKEYVAGVNTSGFCIISAQVADMPVAGAAWMGIINCSNGSKQITVYKVSNNKPCAFSMIYFAPSDVWYEWVCLSDGGNAASVGAYTESAIAALEARIAALEGK